MVAPYASHSTTWFFKFCESFVAGIAIISFLTTALEFLPLSFWEQHSEFVRYQLAAIPVLALAGSIVYTWIWHRREKMGTVNSDLRHAWMQGIIRYWLAFEIASYGFAKILKTQFQTPDYGLDIPLGEVNGFGLTWYYFGYSYTLAVLIALFQIGGSILLLYRRTTLLGVMILLPVLVNIIFINIFYTISSGALFNSVIFTLGLVFLLLIDVEKLKAAFWELVDRLPPVYLGHSWVKSVVRVLPIAAAFALIMYYVQTETSDRVLKGTWRVEKLIRNGRVVPATAWLTDTTVWSRVYFSGWQGCAFSPNPYRYRPVESLRGSYTFDSLKNSLQIIVYSATAKKAKKDTLRATISKRTPQSMWLQGVIYQDTVAMQLARLR